MQKVWRKRLSVFVRGWLCSIVIALLLATSIKSAIADWNVVPTGSMRPTIVEGDRIFVNKLAYDLKFPYTTWRLSAWDDPDRGGLGVDHPDRDDTTAKRREPATPLLLLGLGFVLVLEQILAHVRVVLFPRHPDRLDVDDEAFHCLSPSYVMRAGR